MKLENGYKFIYGVKLEELYATKVLPGVEGKQLVFKNAEGQAIELKQFKLLYSDGENLYGSLLSYPEGPEKDVKIIRTRRKNGENIRVVYKDYADKLTYGSFTNVWTYQNWKEIT